MNPRVSLLVAARVSLNQPFAFASSAFWLARAVAARMRVNRKCFVR